MVIRGYTLGAGTVGWILALLVLIICVVAWFFGKPLTQGEILGLLAMLALSRLL